MRPALHCAGLALLLAAAGLVPAAPAAAGAKADQAWAQCIWHNVPTSAANWLKMPSPKTFWRYRGSQFPPELVLHYRLRAACHDRLVPPGKRQPPFFDSKGVRLALEAQRPESVGPDKVDPMAYRCDRYFPEGRDIKVPAESEWGFGPDTSKAQFYVVTSNIVPQGGPGLLLKQGWPRRCSFIQADGTFQDA